MPSSVLCFLTSRLVTKSTDRLLLGVSVIMAPTPPSSPKLTLLQVACFKPLATHEFATTVVETSEFETTEKVFKFFLYLLPRLLVIPSLAFKARLIL